MHAVVWRSEWRDIITWSQEENGSPQCFTLDGESLLVESSLGHDTTQLIRISAADGSEQVPQAQHSGFATAQGATAWLP